jgi:hypothetical protein
MKRSRLIYALLILTTVILGLASRHFASYLSNWINLYTGDALWALMVFFIIGFVLRNKSTWVVAFLALLFSFAIEVSQLYHAPWIDNLRAVKIGGLILGFGFLWSDLISYTVGILLGIFLEMAIKK